MLPRGKVRLFWVLFGCTLVLATLRLLQEPELLKKTLPANAEEMKDNLAFVPFRILFAHGVRVEWIEGKGYFKKARIPRDLPVDVPYAAIVARIRNLGGTLLRAESNPKGDRSIIEVAFNQEPLFHFTLIRDADISRVSGRIAIVIDDFGYKMDSTVREFLSFGQEITVSVLPGLKYSGKIAELANQNGLDVMIHLPMEPQSRKFKPDDFILLTGMEPKEIRKRVRKAIRAVQHAKGMNNHMGSLASTDAAVVAVLMEEVKRAHLFFLDSMTAPNSVAHTLARKKGVPCALNNVFLDSHEETLLIEQQIKELAQMAFKNGFAIGIGHPKKKTLKVLQEQVPLLRNRGFEFVGVSELVN